jgi:predicted ATPase
VPSAAENDKLRLTKLEIRNWRNFRRAELDLQPRAFLVGPNAAGKSNLLDAIRFLHDVVVVGGGFEAAVRKRSGVSSLRCLAARGSKSDVELTIHLGVEVDQPTWRYELSFSQTSQREPILKRERVYQGQQVRLDRPNADDDEDPARLSQTFLEQVNVNRDFRPIADFLREVRYQHIVPQLVREPDRSVGKKNDPYGGDFLEQVAEAPVTQQKARLRRIVQALRVAVPQLQELEIYQDVRGVHHLRGRYEHWRPHGAWQSESDFSDGTLRLLGLLWAVLDGTGPLLLEEPELSLHPGVVRHIPSMMSRIQQRTSRQIIVSTQSNDLLQDDGIGLDEVFLLLPGEEGTEVHPAGARSDVRALLESGMSMGDAVMPITRPEKAEQLSLFPGR